MCKPPYENFYPIFMQDALGGLNGCSAHNTISLVCADCLLHSILPGIQLSNIRSSNVLFIVAVDDPLSPSHVGYPQDSLTLGPVDSCTSTYPPISQAESVRPASALSFSLPIEMGNIRSG